MEASVSTGMVPAEESVAVSWDINYSNDAVGKTEVECNLTGSPSLSTTLPGLDDSPITLDWSDFSDDPTSVIVTCEAADDADGPSSGGTGQYDDISASVEVRVEENTPPNADDDKSSTEVGEDISINVLANDEDQDNDTIRISDVGDPDNGTADYLEGTDGAIQTDIVYTPSYAGTATFDYTIRDEHGATDSATVTVTVSDMAASDDYTDESTWCGSGIPEAGGTSIDIDVLDNDTGDNLSITDVTEPTDDSGLNGDTSIVTKSGTDYIRYEAGEDTEGVVGGTTPVTFDYTITNGNTTDTATVTVDVQFTCGVVEVKLRDQNGNPIQADSISVEYAGETLTEYNSDTLYEVVDLFDDGREASISKTNIDLPGGYQLPPTGDWVNKSTAGPDGYLDDDTRSILGF